MRKKITDKTYIKYLSMLCVIVYFTGYITRVNFSTIILEIVNAEGLLKSSISVVVTVNFFAYAFGQLIVGFISKKIKPRWLIFTGMLCTSVLNMLIPFCTNIFAMALVWFLNGFAQSLLWVPIIKILTEYLEIDAYQNAIANVSVASLISTIMIYLISPIIIYFYNWRMIFYLSASAGFIVTAVWHFGFTKVDIHRKQYGHINKKIVEPKGIFEEAIQKSPLLSSGMLYIIISVIMRGVLKDGITAWIPSFIYESYKIPSYFSILMTVTIPIFGILSIKLSFSIYNRLNKNEILVSAILFSVAFFASLVMRYTYSMGAIIALALATIITGSTHGVGFMLSSLLPSRYEKYGQVSTVAGLLNFFVYVGSAISTYGTAKLSELYSWNFTILSWALFALVGFFACYLYLKNNKYSS